MVKININIEGENISEIIQEFLTIGVDLLKSNRKEVREIMRVFADEALEVLLERKTLEKGATLYKKINSEINWTYKHDKE